MLGLRQSGRFMPVRPRLAVGLDSIYMEGLRGLWVMRGGIPIEVISGLAPDEIRGTVPGRGGLSGERFPGPAETLNQPTAAGSWNYQTIPASWNFAGTTMSLLWLANWRDGGAESFPRIIDRSTGTRGTNGYTMYLDTTSGNRYVFNHSNAGDASLSITGASDVWERMAYTRDGASSAFWRDGNDATSDPIVASAAFSTTATEIGIGGTAGGWATSRPWEGQLALVALYSSVVPDGLVREWSERPFLMLGEERTVFDFGGILEASSGAALVAEFSATASLSPDLSVGKPLVAEFSATAAFSPDLDTELLWQANQDQEGFNIDTASSTITNGDTSTPSVTLVPYTMNSALSGVKWNNVYGGLQGASGRTITFTLSGTDRHGGTDMSGIVPWFSEDGGTTWQQFDTVSGTTTLTFSQSGGHSGGTLLFSLTRTFTWSDHKTWLAGLSKTYIQVPDSAANYAGSNTYAFAATSSATDQNSRVVPAQEQIAFWVTDEGNNPDNGVSKRIGVLLTGVHAGEASADWGWQKAVEFLIDADSGGTADQQAAAELIKNFKFWCCPTVNPGRYYSHSYGYGADGNIPAHNPGARWNDSPQNLEYLSNIISAWDTHDITSGEIHALIDFHTLPTDTGAANRYNIHYQPSDLYVENVFEPQADTYFNGSRDALANSGAARQFARDSYTPAGTSQLGITAEQAVREDITETLATNQAQRLLRALEDQLADFLPIQASFDATAAFSPTLTVEKNLVTQFDVTATFNPRLIADAGAGVIIRRRRRGK